MHDVTKNPPLTVGILKDALTHIPDDVHVNVLNDDGDRSANVFVWHEKTGTREFVDLLGYKAFHRMTADEQVACFAKNPPKPHANATVKSLTEHLAKTKPVLDLTDVAEFDADTLRALVATANAVAQSAARILAASEPEKPKTSRIRRNKP